MIVVKARLTKRWSEPLAVVMSVSDFMKPFSMFATLVPAKRWLSSLSLGVAGRAS